MTKEEIEKAMCDLENTVLNDKTYINNKSLGFNLDCLMQFEKENQKLKENIENFNCVNESGSIQNQSSKIGELESTIENLQQENKERKELVNKEEEIIQALKVLGFKYIARDDNGELFAYDGQPYFEIGKYYNYAINVYFSLDSSLFKFIKPTECKSIKEIEENDNRSRN